MAFVAAGTSVEELPAALGGVVYGPRVTRDEAIERGVERQLRAFVGRDGAQQIAGVGRTAEDLSEGVLVFRDGGDPGHGSVEARLAHLDGVDDRQRRLLLERLHPPVPELRLVVKGVQNGRGVALADTAFDTDGGGPPVGERARDHGRCCTLRSRPPTGDRRRTISGRGRFSRGSADCQAVSRRVSRQPGLRPDEWTSGEPTARVWGSAALSEWPYAATQS